jgi:hypothetical protein
MPGKGVDVQMAMTMTYAPFPTKICGRCGRFVGLIVDPQMLQREVLPS